MTTRTGRIVLTFGACALLLAACSSESSPDTSTTAETSATAPSAARSEAASATPRLTVGYDGGIAILDAASLDIVGNVDVDGFARLDPAGDGRHVVVRATGAFRVLDTGAWSTDHGDHAHHYTADPSMTETSWAADEPGHVVHHDDRTVLFDDATGRVTSFASAALSDGTPAVDTFTTPEPHHGVAVELGDDLLTTVGTEDSRTGIVVLDGERREIVRNETCPGVHGEGIAANDSVVVGCENGLLVYRDGTITKVTSPDPYGRIGNQAGSDESPYVLGDYKTDPNAELERPTRVSITDTRDATMRLVDIGASYTFRSLGRGPDGTALVLGTDGALHEIDPVTASVTRTIGVIGAWTEPEDWQQPRPALFVQGTTAYVTDPATRSVHAVDLASGTITETAALDEAPNEITGVEG